MDAIPTCFVLNLWLGVEIDRDGKDCTIVHVFGRFYPRMTSICPTFAKESREGVDRVKRQIKDWGGGIGVRDCHGVSQLRMRKSGPSHWVREAGK